jgi:hypothetical protein
MHQDNSIIEFYDGSFLKINRIVFSLEEKKKCYGVSTLPQVSSDGSMATITPMLEFLLAVRTSHNSQSVSRSLAKV